MLICNYGFVVCMKVLYFKSLCQRLVLVILLVGRSGLSSGLSVEKTSVRVILLLFLNLSNFIYPTLSVSFGRDTKLVGLFYLMSMPGEVKDPTQENGKNLSWTHRADILDLPKKHIGAALAAAKTLLY